MQSPQAATLAHGQTHRHPPQGSNCRSCEVLNEASEFQNSLLSLATFPPDALVHEKQQGLPSDLPVTGTAAQRLLASIFDPSHHTACEDQEISTITTLCSYFSHFCHEEFEAQQHELEALQSCCSRICFAGGVCGVLKWYPSYGAVLLQSDKEDGSELHQLMIVGLDKWVFNVHMSSHGYQHSSGSEAFAILMLAKVHKDEIAAILDQAESLCKSNARSRTPEFLHWALKAARDNLNVAGPPVEKEGFTDVAHKRQRNTSWPLLCAALLALLEQCHGHVQGRILYLRSVAGFQLFLLESILQSLRTSSASGETTALVVSQDDLNTCMAMLKQVALQGADLHDLGEDVNHLIVKCNAARLNLEGLRKRDGSDVAERFKLPSLEVAAMRNHCSLPSLIIPEFEKSQSISGFDAICRTTAGNIGWLPTPTVLFSSCSGFAHLLKWYKDATLRPRDPVALQLVLRSLERTMFQWWFLKMDRACENASDVLPLVHAYRTALKNFKTVSESRHHMQAELRSREILVAWVAFCFIHAKSARSHDFGAIVLEFGVALRWTDLHHLVLSDRLARETCLSVCTYLRENFEQNKGLFDLAAQGPTFDFALRVSKGSVHILKIWKDEQSRHADRVDAYWKEVQKKQALARYIRTEIAELEERLVRAKRDLEQDRCHLPCRIIRRYCSACTKISNGEQAVSELKGNISSKETELAYAEKAPPPLIQSLPAGEDKALTVLFFMHMPALLKSLAEITLLAQDLLLPDTLRQDLSSIHPPFHPHRAWDLGAQFTVINLPTSWCTVRNSAQNYAPSGPCCAGAEGRVFLRSQGQPPTSCGPSHVDSCTSRSNGIWYPDIMSCEMAWLSSRLGGGSYINPFAGIPQQVMVCCCTEQLALHHPQGSRLEWAMAQMSTSAGSLESVSHSCASRGNWAVAMQDQRPSWLTKEEFLEFGGLRAYPLLQLRKMCMAIKFRTLPLGHTAVQVLLKQLLFHIGELVQDKSTSGQSTALLWKTELLQDGGNTEFSSLLLSEMRKLLDELKEKPSESGSVLLLGELASHLSEYHSPFRQIARVCAQLSEQRARLLEAEIEKHSSSPSRSTTLRRKRKLMHLHAILSFSHCSELEAADAAWVVQLMVQVQNGDVLDSGEGESSNKEVDRLLTLARSILCSNVSCILDAIKEKSSILTDAVKGVVQNAPHELAWTAFDVVDGSLKDVDCSVCFYARHERDVFSINVLTGQILFNGLPLRGLPKAILDHALYQRSFGTCNFEVKVTQQQAAGGVQGSFQTARYVQGRFLYSFHLNENGVLFVEEYDKELDQTLELLDGVKPASWGNKLPKRLQEMHSHWFSRTEQVLVLRPVDYRKHDVSFIGVVSKQRLYDSENEGRDIDDGWSASAESDSETGGDEDNAIIDARDADNGEPELGWDYKCFEIPVHRRTQAWTSFLAASTRDDLEFIVLCTSPLLGNVSKFEHPACVHTFSSQNGLRFRISFPRYKLDFELAEGAFLCKTYRGYAMESCQQLADTLIGFEQYLVLRLATLGHDIEGRSQQLIIVPQGRITKSGETYRIETDVRCEAALDLFAYEVHPRFGYFQASSMASRLHLAALYAATGTALPEERLQMTGWEHAAALVRQSWINAPLTPLEHACLQQVAAWSSACPMLSLLCHDLFRSSQSLRFLHPETLGAATPLELPGVSLDELLTAYVWERRGGPHHPRRALAPAEERSIMMTKSVPMFTQWKEGKLSCLETRSAWIAADLAKLEKYNAQLRDLIMLDPSNPVRKQSVDFIRKSCKSAIGKQMLDELNQSCALHAGMPVHILCHQLEIVHEKVQSILLSVETRRKAAEASLLEMMNSVPDSAIESMPRLRLLQAANGLPLTQVADVAQFACDEGLVQQFNPLLDKETRALIFRATLVWLQWCTMEDRLRRTLAHTKLGLQNPECSRAPLVQELQARRLWTAADHPEWLVLEVEGRIQIRLRQYEVVKHLMANPGSIVQLNMGEGKTRVILPMLWLWLTRTRSAVVRAHFLSTLLPEAKEYMQRHLSASLIGRRLYFMPFHRDVELNADRMSRMSASLAACQHVGGMLMMAPEHRLSLHLKCLEQRLVNPMEHSVFHDIFDESDVILNHGYQLVYAVGAPYPLQSGSSRWNAAQAILRVFAQCSELTANLIRANAATLVEDRTRQSVYPRIRLNGGRQLDDAMPQILDAIASQLVARPPYELKWIALELSKDAERRSSLLQCMVDKAVTSKDALADLDLPPAALEDMLALRGFLAHGVFAHCMKKRFRVEFGLKRDGLKNMAVPYRAADTPSQRSEFAHPDCQIFLTILSFYYDGLEQADVKAAVAVLLRLGSSAREAFYRRWFDTGAKNMDASTRADLDSVNKLDLSNPSLMEKVFHAYRRNPETVNFFLNNCILPQETSQYPQTLRASAWNLADNSKGTSLGFSGTNDQFRLLPLQVSQLFPDDPELSGTNGKMVQVLLDNPAFFTVPTEAPCESTQGPASPLAESHSAEWQRVLVFSLAFDALIDSGGLLAGASNLKAAEFLTQRLPEHFKAVTFFNVDHNRWEVLDRDGSLQSKQASPIRTQDTFAFFDESRCRGADLKLRQNAVAVVTVGQKMLKDKLMQAAGRMRQLTSGQKLVFLGTQDVATKLQEVFKSSRRKGRQAEAPSSTRLTSKELLCWVMGNTVQATADGILQWGDKGSAFFTTKDDAEHAAFDEDTTLAGFYQHALTPQPCSDVVQRVQRAYLKRVQPGVSRQALSSPHAKSGGASDHEVADQDHGPAGAVGVEVDSKALGDKAVKDDSSEMVDVGNAGDRLDHPSQADLAAILQHVDTLGSEVLTERSAVDEECERELEREEEEEEEEEKEVKREAPRLERDWDYSSLLMAARTASIRSKIQVDQLGAVLWMLPAEEDVDGRQQAAPEGLRALGIQWSETISVTENFWQTIANCSQPSGEHLRPVDALWQFPSGELLLLSEREADSVLRLLWLAPADPSGGAAEKSPKSKRKNSHQPGPRQGIKGFLRHLGYLREDSDLSKMKVCGREPGECTADALVCLQLFQGDTTYQGESRKSALGRVVDDGVAELQAKMVVAFRGKQSAFPYSDLELSKYRNIQTVLDDSAGGSSAELLDVPASDSASRRSPDARLKPIKRAFQQQCTQT